MDTNRIGWGVRAVLVAVAAAGCGGEAAPPAVASAPAPAPAQPTASEGAPARASEPPPPQASTPPAPVAQAPAPAPATAPKPQFPLWDLLTRRDLWPPKVALVEPLTIERGVTLPVGHELALYEFNGSDIVLDLGTDVIECPAARTDVLERAYAINAALTPEQLALTDNTLGTRPELWPVRVRTTRRLTFQGGKELPAGTEAALRSVTNNRVSLYADELGDHFQAEVFETDVLAQARARMLLPESDRTPFFARSLAAALEPQDGAGDLAGAQYVLLYRARLGCPRCAAFAPELAETYARLKAADPRFEAVFWSDDRTAEDARAVREHEKLPGRAVRFDRRLAAADLASQQGSGLLPLLTLYDRAGNRLAQNHPQGGTPSATDVLAELEARLAASR
jgi:hypothetical protein